MNYICNYFISIILFLTSTPLWAKSLEQAAKNLDQKGTNLALIIAPIGIVLAAVYLVLGKEEGKHKVSLAIMGAILIVSAKPLLKWIQGVF